MLGDDSREAISARGVRRDGAAVLEVEEHRVVRSRVSVTLEERSAPLDVGESNGTDCIQASHNAGLKVRGDRRGREALGAGASRRGYGHGSKSWWG